MSFKNVFFLILVFNYVYGKEERIIGGFRARRINFPYQAVLMRIADNTIIGGGAIISHYHILTAAHVVDERSIPHTNLKICLGGFNQTHEFVSEYLPSQIFIHPGYTRGVPEQQSHINDIAIIKTRGSIYFNLYQRKIELPNINLPHDQKAVLSGWGSVSYPRITFPYSLRTIQVIILDPLTCLTKIPMTFHADHFCAFLGRGFGPCISDGGSPLVKDGVLIGIFSMSYFCAYGIPDIYTNVYAHKPFIASVMAS